MRVPRVLRRDAATTVGAVIVAVSILLAIVGPSIVPYDPERATGDVLLAPSSSHLFGTDASGIDVFSRVVAAFRSDVFIALVAVAISSIGGVILGALTGYRFRSRGSRAASWIVLRLGDVVQALPVFILALALVGMTGPSVRNVVIAIAFVNLPIFLRLTRGAVLVTEREAYVDAARVMGLPPRRILTRHVVPNSLEPVLANASVTVGFAVLLTAGLSFLGAGVRPPTPEWGAAIAAGSKNLVTGEWWISVLPGIVLSIVVLGFALLGDGLRRAWDPAGRQTIDPRTEAR
jgi:peptide/nickel transport system permease protein